MHEYVLNSGEQLIFLETRLSFIHGNPKWHLKVICVASPIVCLYDFLNNVFFNSCRPFMIEFKWKFKFDISTLLVIK